MEIARRHMRRVEADGMMIFGDRKFNIPHLAGRWVYVYEPEMRIEPVENPGKRIPKRRRLFLYACAATGLEPDTFPPDADHQDVIARFHKEFEASPEMRYTEVFVTTAEFLANPANWKRVRGMETPNLPAVCGDSL